MSDLLMNVKISTTGSGKAIDDIRNSLRDLQKLAGAISGIQIGSGIIESFRDANMAAEQFIRSINAVKGVGQGCFFVKKGCWLNIQHDLYKYE